MALLDMVAELTGVLPGLSPLLAQKYVQRAFLEVLNKRNWSFLVTDGVAVCPPAITDGSVALTQYSTDVTLDTDASAAIAAQLVPGSVPGILQLQIRFGGAPTNGPVYSIVDFDDSTPTAVVLTLDRIVVESTNASSTYQIYRCYLTPPIADFLRWESIVDVPNAIAIVGDRLRLTSAELDRRDPQRASQGLAYFLASWGGNRVSDPVTGDTNPNATVDASTPIYELWPHPVSGQTFFVRFRRKGETLLNQTDELPQQIPESLVIARALGWHAYPFAQANVSNFPTFKNAAWVNLIAMARQNFAELLLDAKRNDNASQLQDVWNRGHGLRTFKPFGRFGDMAYPIDSNFLQSHLIRF